MVAAVTALRLAGYAAGALGGLLLFLELFQQPSYVEYEPEFDTYSVNISPGTVVEHTWLGRTGAVLVALAFATQFLATFLGA